MVKMLLWLYHFKNRRMPPLQLDRSILDHRMPTLKQVLCYLMGAAYIAAGINHFLNPGFYVNIMPEYLPWHEALVALSGVAEIVLGALLFIPRYRSLAAWGIIAMLIVFLIVHIDMIRSVEKYPKITPVFLWIRLLLQVPLILWAYWYTHSVGSRESGVGIRV